MYITEVTRVKNFGHPCLGALYKNLIGRAGSLGSRPSPLRRFYLRALINCAAVRGRKTVKTFKLRPETLMCFCVCVLTWLLSLMFTCTGNVYSADNTKKVVFIEESARLSRQLSAPCRFQLSFLQLWEGVLMGLSAPYKFQPFSLQLWEGVLMGLSAPYRFQITSCGFFSCLCKQAVSPVLLAGSNLHLW